MNIEENNDGMVVNAYFTGMVTVSDLVRYLVQNCDPDAPLYMNSATDPGNLEEIVGLINAPGEHVTIMTLPEAADESEDEKENVTSDTECNCSGCQLERAHKKMREDGLNGLN